MLKNTKAYLVNHLRCVEVNNVLCRITKRKGLTPLNFYTNTKKHKYGDDLTYELTVLYDYINKKYVAYTKQQIMYIWYKGDIPKGYDVDHINGDTLDNNIDNLQILTRSENLKKRKAQANQYTIAKEKGLTIDHSTRKKYEHTKAYLEKHEETK